MRRFKSNGVAVDYDYLKSIGLSIELNRWTLQVIGAWPNFTEKSRREQYFCRAINVVCYISILFLLIPCTVHVFLEVDEIYEKLRLTGPLSFCIMAIVKYYTLINRSEDIRKCLKYIESDWRTVTQLKDRLIVTENAIFGRRLIGICAFFMYGSAFFFYIVHPASVGKIAATDENLTFIPLPFPMGKFFIDSRRSPVNEIIFSAQLFSGFIAHNITVAVCGLAATFVLHAHGQLEVLMLWLEHLVKGREDFCNDVEGRLSMIVQQHVRTLSFISLVETILRNVSLVEIMGSTLNMCLLGYYIIMEVDITKPGITLTYTVLLVSLTFNIFIFCYIGELIAEQVADATYMTEWYHIPGKTGIGLTLIIRMANSSVQLTAGNFIELSLSSFGDVVKTSVAYLNMLRTLTM